MRQTDNPHSQIRLRLPDVDDATILWRLARDSDLDLNSPYSYLLLCREFADTCLVAEREDTIIGFVTGFRPPSRPEVVFVWQVAVAAAARECGVGVMLVDELVARAIRQGACYLEATVTPSNEPSRRLFASVAHRRAAALAERTLFEAAAFPGSAHEDEVLLRIGPFDPAEARAPNVSARVASGIES